MLSSLLVHTWHLHGDAALIHRVDAGNRFGVDANTDGITEWLSIKRCHWQEAHGAVLSGRDDFLAVVTHACKRTE